MTTLHTRTLKELQAAIAWASSMGNFEMIKMLVTEVERRENMLKWWCPKDLIDSDATFDELYQLAEQKRATTLTRINIEIKENELRRKYAQK